VGADLKASAAKQVYDGKGLLAFPGVVDAHMHAGIYSPLAEDAVSESRAAAQGGVTSMLNYFRTGQYYLNKGGPYAQVLPRGAEDLGRQVPRRLRLPPRADGSHHIAEIPSWWRSSAWPRSRSSCSTARTGCTAAPTASATS
jgi:allantoinase